MDALPGFPYSLPFLRIYVCRIALHYPGLFLLLCTFSIHVMRSLDCRASVIDLETRLGFNFKKGLSKEHRAKQTIETSELLEGIRVLNNAYVSFGLKEIRNSQEIKREAGKLFNDLGNTLWPAEGPLATWLLRPEQLAIDDNPRLNLYPKQLVFSNPEDREM
jgi:hypothetical protein